MNFLVQIRVSLPPQMTTSERDDLLDAELKRGQELRDAGHITSIWRIPGRIENVGVWSAADATELHALISSLPLFNWMSASVTALATHPVMEHRP